MDARDADLLNRFLNGDLDRAELEDFYLRVAAAPALRAELVAQSIDEVLVSELLLEESARRARRPRRWLARVPPAAAAAVLLAILGFLIVPALRPPSARIVSVARGTSPEVAVAGQELRPGQRVSGSLTLESEGGWRIRLDDARVRLTAGGVELLSGRVEVEASTAPVAVRMSGTTVELAVGRSVSTPDRAPRDAAVLRACRFLESRKDVILTPLREGKRHDPVQPRTYGELAVLALVRSGVYPEGHPAIEVLVEGSLKHPIRTTYTAALRVLALLEVDPVRNDSAIRQAVRYLVETQAGNGQWDYGPAMPGRRPPSGDNHCSAYAAFALAAARRAGIAVDPDVIDLARRSWVDHQNRDGGWGYNDSGGREIESAPDPVKATNASYGSMTAYGLAALLSLSSPGAEADPAVVRAAAWLSSHAAVDRNPGKAPGFAQLHFAVALQRASVLAQGRVVVPRDLPAGLLSRQSAEGSWLVEDGPFMATDRNEIIDTCLAILFLSRNP